MKSTTIKSIILFSLLNSYVQADTIADTTTVHNNWANSSFLASKNSIMGGATTATAKGYNAMFSNPAGFSTHANVAIYTKVTVVERKDNNDNVAKNYDTVADSLAVGILYDSFALEYKVDDYAAVGGAYGYESKYGLFSAGASYLVDQTDLTKKDTVTVANQEFATGDFLTVGVMWQKTFVDEDDFYAVYFGAASKGFGKYSGGKLTTAEYLSPKRVSYGFGVETNMFDTSVLFTIDKFEEEGQDITLDGIGYGLKWLIGEKFAIGGGVSSQTFSGGPLNEITLVGAGIEFGLAIFHFNVSVTQREVTANIESNNLSESAAHVDVAFVF